MDQKFKPFMDWVVEDALKPYENLHAWINDMEEWANNRLRELSIPNLLRFTTELKQAQTAIVELKRQRVSSIFDLTFMEINKDEDLVDLMVKILKYEGKVVDKSAKKSLSRKRRHRD